MTVEADSTTHVDHKAHHDQAQAHDHREHDKYGQHHHLTQEQRAEVRAGRTEARKLEKADASNDGNSYNHVMTEVADYMKKHPHAGNFLPAFEHKLKRDGTLPEVSIHAAERALDKRAPGSLDSIMTGQNVQTNPVEKQLLKDAAKYTGAASPDAITREGVDGMKDRIKVAKDAREEAQDARNNANLLALGPDGTSYADKFLRDPKLHKFGLAGGVEWDKDAIDAKIKHSHGKEASALLGLKTQISNEEAEQKAKTAQTAQTNDARDQSAIKHLAEKPRSTAVSLLGSDADAQKTLLDKIDRDANGNLAPGSIQKLRDQLVAAGQDANSADIKALDALNNARTWGSKVPWNPDMTKDELAAVLEKNGVVTKPSQVAPANPEPTGVRGTLGPNMDLNLGIM